MSTTIQSGNRVPIEGAAPPKRPKTSAFGGSDGSFGSRLRRYRLALGLWIASIVMLFVGFSSAYVVRRGIPTYETTTGAYSAMWEPLRLPIGLLILNTMLLIAASGSIEFARRSTAIVNDRPKLAVRSHLLWINVTALLIAGFLVGQGFAWLALRADGSFMTTGARSAFFYVLTGTHALHCIVGVLAVGWLAIRCRQWSIYERGMAVDLTAWYLHSMTVLWLYVFGFLIIA
ncbi:MAG: heme-copper oxidase subunit III [Terriglobales bacterium]